MSRQLTSMNSPRGGWTFVILLWTNWYVRAYSETFYRDPMTQVSLHCRSDEQQAHGGCDRSAEDAYSSMAPDPAFAFVEGPCCPTLDFTPAMVMWKKQNDEMLFYMEDRMTSDKYYSLDRSYNDWNLVIDTILERHEGVYLCLQIIKGTQITIKEYTLFVNGPPERAPNSPWMTNLAVVEGDVVDMRCDMKGSPEPSISWFSQDGDQINPIHITGPLLQVRNITRLCVTKFVCLAENRFSKSPINMTFSIDVEFPTQILVYDAKPSKTDISSATIYRKRGTEVILRCDVMASPGVKIYWKVKKRKKSRLREIATFTPGGGVSNSSKRKEENVYRFEYHLLPQKKVTIFDMIFTTDQNFTFSEYVCETDGNKFPGTKKSLTVVMLP